MQDGMNITAIRDAIEKVCATFNEWSAVGASDWHETQTRYAIIDPILRALGWDTSDPKACRPEWQYEGSRLRVDYALFSGNTPRDFDRGDAVPVIIIECKLLWSELWEEDGHQLQNYVDAEPRMTEGLAVLTSGKRWIMYLIGDGRRLVDIPPDVVNLIDDDPDFVAGKLAQLMGWRNW